MVLRAGFGFRLLRFLIRGFLFLWVLGMGCVILLWHSLSLPYNYFAYFYFQIQMHRAYLPSIYNLDTPFVMLLACPLATITRNQISCLNISQKDVIRIVSAESVRFKEMR